MVINHLTNWKLLGHFLLIHCKNDDKIMIKNTKSSYPILIKDDVNSIIY